MNLLARGPLLALATCLSTALVAQQVPDSAFRPPVDSPAYAFGTGPVVLIDEAHSNFHTATGRYFPFADLLRRDGYVVAGSPVVLTAETLGSARVLVTANARQPFAGAEVAVLRDWVRAGGAVLLIVDHPPFVEATSRLAEAFGVRLRNAGAGDPRIASGRLVFRRSDGTLLDHAITSGIDSVATFTGSSFQLEAAGQPLLVFGPGVYSYTQPDEPHPLPLQGHFQGAVLQFGGGRVGVFAEAAMFSAQLTGPNRSPMGMNAPIAGQNARFLLNLVHWLAGQR